MAHEIAKLLLAKADTFIKRGEAIKAALSLGMPLDEIEAYFDWLDHCREYGPPPSNPEDSGEGPSKTDPP